MTFRLVDSFNATVISTHRSLEAAVKAERSFLRAIRRNNGPGSYVTTEIDVQIDDRVWTQVDPDEITEVRFNLDQ